MEITTKSKDNRQPDIEPQPKKKRKTKAMNKQTRKTLQDSIRSIDLDVLLKEVTTALIAEEFADGSFVNDLCESKQLLTDLVEYLRNTFAMLHSECKREKNSQMRFQLRWYSYCSAFLLEEKYSLSAINLKEAEHAVLANLRQVWLEFCRQQSISVPERNSVMTTLCLLFTTVCWNVWHRSKNLRMALQRFHAVYLQMKKMVFIIGLAEELSVKCSTIDTNI